MALQTQLLDPAARPGEMGSIDKFPVVRQIGQGGMGVVFLARHPVSGDDVAIKVITPNLVNEPRSVHRFLTEARHMSRLTHPNILRVLDVSDRPAGPYYVMPYMRHGSLAQLLRRSEALDFATCLRVAKGLANALDYAHERGIIHRDLKPANLLLDDRGEICLSDFGLVRTVFNDSIIDVRDSYCEGTVAYMSPAVARGAAEDTRCDIYSFGAVLYEMLTGQLPYEGRTAHEVVEKILRGPPPPIRSRNPRADTGLARIAEGAMARELRDRYTTMADVVIDLERVERRIPPLGPRGEDASGPAAFTSTMPVVAGASSSGASSSGASSSGTSIVPGPDGKPRKSFSVQANLRSMGCSMTVAMALLVAVGGYIYIHKDVKPASVAKGPSETAPPSEMVPVQPRTGEGAPFTGLGASEKDTPAFAAHIQSVAAEKEQAGSHQEAHELYLKAMRVRSRSLGENDLLNATNPSASFSVELSTVDGKTTYLEGEEIAFKIKATQGCYITLVTMDSEGTVTLLLPNAFQKRPAAAPAEVIVIPRPEDTFRFPVAAPFGMTLVKVIATSKPIELNLGPESSEPFQTLPNGVKAIRVVSSARPTPRQIVVEPAKAKSLKELLADSEWTTAEIVIETRARPLRSGQ